MDGEKKDGDDKVATELERRRSHGGEGIAVQSMGTSSDDSDDNDDDDDDLDDLDDDEVELQKSELQRLKKWNKTKIKKNNEKTLE